ncbi:hypothetical protein FQN52_009335 [Onygenales sp. PD_12]|nr:hypothetical protein FQN52_009335 [Onygenales sp. PD_12]
MQIGATAHRSRADNTPVRAEEKSKEGGDSNNGLTNENERVAAKRIYERQEEVEYHQQRTSGETTTQQHKQPANENEWTLLKHTKAKNKLAGCSPSICAEDVPFPATSRGQRDEPGFASPEEIEIYGAARSTVEDPVYLDSLGSTEDASPRLLPRALSEDPRVNLTSPGEIHNLDSAGALACSPGLAEPICGKFHTQKCLLARAFLTTL